MIGPDFSVVGGITSLNKMIMKEIYDEISVDFSPSMHQRNLPGRFSLWIRSLIFAPFIRIFRPPDVVHIHVSSDLSMLRKTSIGNMWNMLGVPVIYHTHGSKARDFIEGSSFITKWVISRRFRRASAIITLSEGWKKWYSENLGIESSRFAVLPTPIALPPLQEIDQKERGDVLYSGLMGLRKGTFDLIEAWSRSPDEEKYGRKLHLIGNGDVSEAREKSKQLNQEGTCIIHGWVSEEEKIELMRSCGIYVLPSHNEGLPMGLLEAMSWGLSPISTGVGAIPEIIINGENGILVPPGNVDEISLAIRSLMDDPSKRHAISASAIETAKEHDWEEYIGNLTTLWKEKSR
mgnify:CR=1 FL=1